MCNLVSDSAFTIRESRIKWDVPELYFGSIYIGRTNSINHGIPRNGRHREGDYLLIYRKSGQRKKERPCNCAHFLQTYYPSKVDPSSRPRGQRCLKKRHVIIFTHVARLARDAPRSTQCTQDGRANTGNKFEFACRTCTVGIDICVLSERKTVF